MEKPLDFKGGGDILKKGQKIMESLPDTIYKAWKHLKGSKKDPFLYLWAASLVLFFLTACTAPSENFNSVFYETPDSQGRVFLFPEDKVKESPDLCLVQNNSLASVSPPIMATPQVLGALMEGSDFEGARREIIEYEIKKGDSLWSIAVEFGVSIDTIIWANDVDSALIRPGQKLLILPVSGVMHLVESGDTVSTIAEEYKAEAKDVFAFNDINGNGDVFEGEVLIIPGGQMPSYSSVSQSSTAETLSGLSTNDFYGKSHAFPYGQCTWWVAQKRAVPTWGNAKDWLPNAAAAGYSTCTGRYCVPQTGAVISLEGHRLYGHVGYVEQVKGNKVVFSEMNYIGWGKMNYRTLTVGDPLIKGYIY